MASTNWNDQAKALLKDELSRRDISNEQLVRFLSAIGIKETKSGIDSKISRGTFSASFFIQVLSAIGCKSVNIPLPETELTNIKKAERKLRESKMRHTIFTDEKTNTRYIDIEPLSQVSTKRKPTVISLFSGAGGLDIGLEQAGYETLVCVDNDQDCRETLKHNRPDWKVFESIKYEEDGKTHERLPGDVRYVQPEELLKLAGKKKGNVSLVVGGAPCQPFSNIGKKMGKDDEKNGDLFLEFVRIVKGVDPQAFIFENVAGITQKKHNEVIDYMVRQFTGMNYGISHTILNAANHGVGQRRERFFLIGIKNIDNPAFPLPSHYKDEKSWESFIKYFDVRPDTKPQPWITVQNVFDALPNDYKERSDYAVMGVSDIVGKRMRLIEQGQNFKVLPLELRPNCWKNGKHQGSDTFGRLVADLPSVTIRTAAYNSAKGRYIHPHEHRGLNTIEMAALQSFPYEWEFKSKGRDKVTLVSGGRQIGNAVPPTLAKALGQAIYIQLKESKKKSREFQRKQRELAEAN